jgi:hypothetical protein
VQCYRSHVAKKHTSKTPLLPFLPLVTKDLRFLADASMSAHPHLIDFSRYVIALFVSFDLIK